MLCLRYVLSFKTSPCPLSRGAVGKNEAWWGEKWERSFILFIFCLVCSYILCLTNYYVLECSYTQNYYDMRPDVIILMRVPRVKMQIFIAMPLGCQPMPCCPLSHCPLLSAYLCLLWGEEEAPKRKIIMSVHMSMSYYSIYKCSEMFKSRDKRKRERDAGAERVFPREISREQRGGER